MTRLLTLFVLGGAGVLVSASAAPAQFPRAFGFPGGVIPPVVTPIGPVAPFTPFANPRFSYRQTTQFSFRTVYGGFNYTNTQFYAGSSPAYALRPYAPVYAQTSAYTSGGTGSRYILSEQENLMRAQREAALASSLSSGGGGRKPGTGGVAGELAPLPAGRALPAATAAKLASGEALNDVVKQITAAESAGAKGPSAYIPPALLKDVRFAGSPAADLFNFARPPALEIPAAFDAPALAVAKGELVKEFAPAAEAVRAGKGVDGNRAARVEAAFGALEKAAAPVVKGLPFEESAEATRFLNRMGGAVKALKSGAGPELINPKWADEGLTGADLVRHMTKHKLQFGPAPRGEEEAYEALHKNLATYLFALAPAKK